MYIYINQKASGFITRLWC